MSTYAHKDDCTDILLDLIAEHESAGNYNAVIGNVHATADLGQHDFAGIYLLMADLLAIGRPSTAVGRYQIIRDTLRSLQTKLQLSGSERFTPELQDRLAIQLMVNRGYSTWWRGEMSDEDFAHGLSCEWASLPDPRNGGKSHYDGVGPNRAGTTLEHVYDALSRARKAISTSPPAGSAHLEPPAPIPIPVESPPVPVEPPPEPTPAPELPPIPVPPMQPPPEPSPSFLGRVWKWMGWD